MTESHHGHDVPLMLDCLHQQTLGNVANRREDGRGQQISGQGEHWTSVRAPLVMNLQAEAEEVDQAAGQQDVHQREEQRHHLWEDVELVVGGQLGQTEHQPAGHLGG